MEERTFFRKIQGNDDVYRIKVTIGSISLSLVIMHSVNGGISIYTSSMISEKNLRIEAEKLHMNFDDYFEKLCLLLEKGCNIKLVISNNVLTLKEEVEPHIEANYFHCSIQKVDNNFIGTLIDDLQTQNENLITKCNEFSLKNEELNKDVINYKEKLNELVNRKIIDEQTMLNNFVSLLNEKKRRIQHLNELLEAFRNDPSLANPVEVNVNTSKKRKIKNLKPKVPPDCVKEEISGSDYSDNDNSTDNENSVNNPNAQDTSIKYDDIFEEPVSEIKPSIIRFPNKNLSLESLPSTSKTLMTNSDSKLEQNEKCLVSESLDNDMMDIDTQEILNNL